MYPKTINVRSCETCQQEFLAEGEKNKAGEWVFSPICLSCDDDLQKVDDILKSRGY
jgi:hypothetical protein